MSENTRRGVIGLVALLLGFGGSMMLDQDSIDHGYVCNMNEKLAFFDRLSSTSKTGYWMEGGIEKSSACTNGQWIKLSAYAQSKGVSVEQMLIQIQSVKPAAPTAKSYYCYPEPRGCEPWE